MTADEILLVIQTIAGVLTLAVAVVQIFWFARDRRAAQLIAVPRVTLAVDRPGRSGGNGLDGLSVIVLLVIGVYVHLQVEFAYVSSIQLTTWEVVWSAIFVASVAGFARWFSVGIVPYLALMGITELVEFFQYGESAAAQGFVALATIALVGFYRYRPIARTTALVFGVTLALIFRAPEQALAAVLASVVVIYLTNRKYLAVTLGIAVLSVAVAVAIRFQVFADRVGYWVYPTRRALQSMGWQTAEYQAAWAAAMPFGPDGDNPAGTWDLAGFGWPIALAIRLGWIPALVVVALAGAVIVRLTVRAYRRRSQNPFALALSIPLLAMFSLNLLSITGVLPIFGIVPIGFSGPIGISAGSIWLYMLVRELAGAELLAFAAAPRVIGAGTLPSLPSPFYRSMLLYLGFVEPRSEFERGITPIKWLLAYVGL